MINKWKPLNPQKISLSLIFLILLVSNIPLTTGCDISPPASKETQAGLTAEAAVALTLDSGEYGQFSARNDERWFKADVQGGVAYYLYLDDEFGSGTYSADPQVAVYNGFPQADDSNLYAFEDRNDFYTQPVSITVAANQTIYIKVISDNPGSTDFLITFSKTLIAPPTFVSDNNYQMTKEAYNGKVKQIFVNTDYSSSQVDALETAVLAKIPDPLFSLATVDAIITDCGLPSRVEINQEAANEGFLNLYYGRVQLFIGFKNSKNDNWDALTEIRLSDTGLAFTYSGPYGDVAVGTSLDAFLAAMGQPTNGTVTGVSIDWNQDEVLFKDINGKAGSHYIQYNSLRVRFFFKNNQVNAIYFK